MLVASSTVRVVATVLLLLIVALIVVRFVRRPRGPSFRGVDYRDAVQSLRDEASREPTFRLVLDALKTPGQPQYFAAAVIETAELDSGDWAKIVTILEQCIRGGSPTALRAFATIGPRMGHAAVPLRDTLVESLNLCLEIRTEDLGPFEVLQHGQVSVEEIAQGAVYSIRGERMRFYDPYVLLSIVEILGQLGAHAQSAIPVLSRIEARDWTFDPQGPFRSFVESMSRKARDALAHIREDVIRA